MITFVLIAVVLVAVALAWLLPPLLRRETAGSTTDRVQLNLTLLRDQLADLEAEFARGAVPAAQYAESKAELERRVLEEAASEERAGAAAPGAGRATAALVGAVVPVAAVILYLTLGDPGALDLQRRVATMGDHTKQPTAQDVEQMLVKLAQRLEKEPDNADGWAMLARSYYVLNRYADAVRAYQNLLRLVPQEPAVLADYADALAMKNGRKISGEPLQIVHQALKIDPTQAKALAMAGTEAFDRQDFKLAVDYWEKLRASLPAGSEMAQSVEGSITEARTRGNLPAGDGAPVAAMKGAPPAKGAAPPAATAAATSASVEGTVKVDAALAGKAAPTDMVFVFARAAEGPRAPLAVLRLQMKDLPAKFTLDDSLAMAPQFKLSNFKNVVVNARVSKSGSATPSPGDLEGKAVPVEVGARNVAITIDRVVQ